MPGEWTNAGQEFFAEVLVHGDLPPKHVATYPRIYLPIYAAISDITRYIYLVFVLASTNKVIDRDWLVV